MKAAVIAVLVLMTLGTFLTSLSVSATPLRPEDVDSPDVDLPHVVVKRASKIKDYEKYLLG